MSPKRRLVEATPSIHIQDLCKAGLRPGAESCRLRAKDRHEVIPLIWRDMHFGGKRVYFRCPCCFRGAEVLYAAPFFACRRCHRLAYRAENLTLLWRKNERLLKLQLRAGIDVSRYPRPLPPKAKWQR